MPGFGTYQRRLWSNPPKQWGPWKAVHRSVLRNLDSKPYGIDPMSCVLAMPMWGPGDQYDYSSNGLIGKNSNVSFSQGRIKFDGLSDASISIDTATMIEPLKITVMAKCIRDGDGTLEYRVLSMDNGTKRNWQLNLANSIEQNPRFLVFSASNTNANASIAASIGIGREYFIGGSYDGTTVKCYLDRNVAETTFVETLAQDGPDFYIGADNNTYTHKLNGSVRDAIIFSDVISDDKINELRTGPSIFRRVPEVYWSIPAAEPTAFSLRIGTTLIDSVKIGTNNVDRIYQGANRIL